jgi:hypothetical protein
VAPEWPGVVEPVVVDAGDELEPPEPDAVAGVEDSASSSEATFRPAVTSAEVAEAAPRTLMSDCPVGPRTKRMNCANLTAFSGAKPDVGTTR